MITSLNLLIFKYHSIIAFIIYLFIYSIELLLNLDVISNNWIIRLSGSFSGSIIHDIFIKYYIHTYYFYFQNIFKYVLILLFQNIISKVLINNYKILNINNMFKINFIIFIYFLLDVIIDVNIKDDNKNKEMYLDIIKATIGFYIIEKILKKELEYKDYIYMIITSIAYYLYHTKHSERFLEHKQK